MNKKTPPESSDAQNEWTEEDMVRVGEEMHNFTKLSPLYLLPFLWYFPCAVLYEFTQVPWISYFLYVVLLNVSAWRLKKFFDKRASEDRFKRRAYNHDFSGRYQEYYSYFLLSLILIVAGGATLFPDCDKDCDIRLGTLFDYRQIYDMLFQ